MTDRLVDDYLGVVCDLDGVVYRGPQAVPHAVESLTATGLPVVYATNNASRPPATVVAHLRGLGLRLDSEDVVTSSQAGADDLARHLDPGSAVLAVGGEGVRLALTERGLRVVTPTEFVGGAPVSAVLQGYGPEVTASDLAQAAYAVQGGARWVATNTDQTLPTDRGTAPGNGMLVAAVRRATGVDPVVVGKPEVPLYLLCATRTGHPVERLLAVGDRLDTDIAGAVASGADSVLVLTGVDDVLSTVAAPTSMRPTYLIEDLRGLLEPYAGVAASGAGHRCGGVTVEVVDGGLAWQGSGPPIERARALVSVLHAAIDAGDLTVEQAVGLAASGDPAVERQ